MNSRQYTLRGISPDLDRCIREASQRSGQSINSIAVEALEARFLTPSGERHYSDMDDLIGTWVNDPDSEAAWKSMRSIDEALWK